MTIGRTDVRLAIRVPPAVALERAVACAVDLWPDAVVADGEDTRTFPGLPSIPYSTVSELLVFRTAVDHAALRQSGTTPATANAMLDLIVDAGALTVVVDDPSDPAMTAFVAAVRPKLGRPQPAPVEPVAL